MSKLVNAILNDNVRTDNGAFTNATSGNSNVDLFSIIGSSRNSDISSKFLEAFLENQDYAIRNLLWARDIRGGAGERKTFRTLFINLISIDEALARRVLKRIPELGRWDDVFEAINTPLKDDVLEMIKNGFENRNGLLAKWFPRNSKHPVHKAVREYMGLSPKQLRQLVVSLSKTVEQDMSARKWEDINYSHVPSVAMARYQKAFKKRDAVRFTQYLADVNAGIKNINVQAIYPFDVIRAMNSGVDNVGLDILWNNLPNYMEGNEENILPVIDVSGSMESKVSGSIKAIDVSISLGMYLSERMNGLFKNHFLTFSENPSLVKIIGKTFRDKYNNIKSSNWGGSTNIQASFDLILSKAVEKNLDQEDLPSKILIISDMEFNYCGNNTNFELIKKKFADAGYKMPTLVFWNVNGRENNVPVTINDENVALVSGFSPSIVKSIFGINVSPEEVMLDTIMKERYDY